MKLKLKPPRQTYNTQNMENIYIGHFQVAILIIIKNYLRYDIKF